MLLSETFKRELDEVEALLADTERRLKSLKDQAEYEELPSAVVQRFHRKGTVLRLSREQLAEIPEMVVGARQ